MTNPCNTWIILQDLSPLNVVCVLKIITFRFTLKHHFSFYNSLTFRFGGFNCSVLYFYHYWYSLLIWLFRLKLTRSIVNFIIKMISFISQEYNKDLPPFFASVFVSYTNWLWWKGNKYIWDSMILEYIIFIQRLLRRVLLFLIQVNYLHINFSKKKIYVIVICYEKEF